MLYNHIPNKRRPMLYNHIPNKRRPMLYICRELPFIWMQPADFTDTMVTLMTGVTNGRGYTDLSRTPYHH